MLDVGLRMCRYKEELTASEHSGAGQQQKQDLIWAHKQLQGPWLLVCSPTAASFPLSMCTAVETDYGHELVGMRTHSWQTLSPGTAMENNCQGLGRCRHLHSHRGLSKLCCALER